MLDKLRKSKHGRNASSKLTKSGKEEAEMSQDVFGQLDQDSARIINSNHLKTKKALQ